MKGLIQRSLALQYLEDNNISYSHRLHSLSVADIGGIEYITIAELFRFSDATVIESAEAMADVEANQSLDTSVDAKTIVSASDPNVVLKDTDYLSTVRKLYVGTIYTDPTTGELVEIDPYNGGSVIADSTPEPLPSAPAVVVSNVLDISATLTTTDIADTGGEIVGHNIYRDGALFASFLSDTMVLTLTPSTYYKFIVKSFNGDGAESVWGTVVSFTTLAPLP